jgi:hypothetical protein
MALLSRANILEAFKGNVGRLGRADFVDFRQIGPGSEEVAHVLGPSVLKLLLDDASDPAAGGDAGTLNGRFEGGFGFGIEVDGDLRHIQV